MISVLQIAQVPKKRTWIKFKDREKLSNAPQTAKEIASKIR